MAQVDLEKVFWLNSNAETTCLLRDKKALVTELGCSMVGGVGIYIDFGLYDI